MKVLITGGSGLLGSRITEKLHAENHEVVFLSRNPGKNPNGVPEFHWNIEKGELAAEALFGVDAVIHLAGAPINKRWTTQYKNTILRSRVDSTRLLFQNIQGKKNQVKCFISASAVGYYPNDFKHTYHEDDAPGSDFLSTVCKHWENEARLFDTINIRNAQVRIGIVLSNQGGALPQIIAPIKWGVGAPIGSGRQWMSWIHIEDLAGIFLHLLKNENLSGPYNAAAPESIINQNFTQLAASILKRPVLPVNVPRFTLKLALGEMSSTVLSSNKVSPEKIIESGYQFQYPKVKDALRDLLT